MKSSTKRLSRAIAFILTVIITINCTYVQTKADSSIKKNFNIVVDGNEVGSIAVLDVNYEGNIFISLGGLAYYLRDTAKAFNLSVGSNEINIRTNENCYDEPYLWNSDETMQRTKWKLERPKMYINDVERKYYSIIGDVNENDRRDVFYSPLSIAMFLNLTMQIMDNTIYVATDSNFYTTSEELEASGYLQGVNALLIGDGTTGEVYYGYNSDTAVPIASTTKLMSYFILMDAVANGEVTLDDYVSISDNAVRISQSIDAVIPFEGKSGAPMQEMIAGMLLSSSNECALAIAEHVAGSEAEFVNRMNDKAEELLMTTAKFYNCNGLPRYEGQLHPAKMQNHMSAYDMFILISELMKTYPQILDITSTKAIGLSTLGFEAKNTNALVYNMSEVKGLKTGTTNKSGACLTICMPVEKDGVIHNLICVLFGAEGDFDRTTVSEVASRIALFELEGASGSVEHETYGITPEDPEIDVKRMLKNLK